MKRKRYTEEQIIGILKGHEAGVSAPELARRHGVSEQSIYRWKAKFGGMEARMRSGCGSWRRRTGA